jgi:hypothetical protein
MKPHYKWTPKGPMLLGYYIPTKTGRSFLSRDNVIRWPVFEYYDCGPFLESVQ